MKRMLNNTSIFIFALFCNPILSQGEKTYKLSTTEKNITINCYKDGQKYLKEEKYDLALFEFNKAVKKDPRFAVAWDNMGVCYQKTKHFDEAIKCYKKSLTLDPKSYMPLLNLAIAHDLLNQYQSASNAI